MKKFILFFAFIGVMATSSVIAQFDTEFWFATSYIEPAHDPHNQFRFVFSSSNQPATITITRPADPNFIPIIRNMAANATMNINLSTMIPAISGINVNAADAVLNYGYKITASTPVFCYYEIYTVVNPLNNEIFSLKGKNALGTDFLVPMQNYLNNDSRYSNARAYFMVLATEDGTEVTITPTKNIVGYSAGTTFKKQLNAGQYYVAKAVSPAANERPAGTEVTSNKKVTVIYSDDSMRGEPWGGCGDVGGDQIVPINMLGKRYIAVQGYTHFNSVQDGSRGPYDEVFILSTENNNRIRVNGSYLLTLNRGETHRYSFTTNPFTDGRAVLIESDDPIYVSQMSGFGCEASISILPSIDCRGSQYVSMTRTTSLPFYLTLLTESENIGNFTFNGNSNVILPSQFKPVEGNANWMFLQRELTLAQFPLNGYAKIENSGVFHMGIIFGSRTGASHFGYFSDFAEYQFKMESFFGDTLCEGQTLELNINEIDRADFYWKCPDGTTIPNEFKLIIPEIKVSQSGTYSVHGTVRGCNIIPDTAFVLIKEKPRADFIVKTIRCYPNPIEFANASDNVGENTVYTWDFGDGSQSHEESPSYAFLTPGTYRVKLTVSSLDCKDSVEFDVTMPDMLISYDTVHVCEAELPFEYGNITIPNFGNYEVTFKTPDGCDSLVQLLVKVSYPVDLYYSDTTCAGHPYTKNGFNIPAAVLTPDLDKDGITYEYTETFQTVDGCDSTRHLALIVKDPTVTIQMLIEPFCQDHYTILSAETRLPYISWNTGDTLSIIKIDSVGNYIATATGYNCLPYSDSLLIKKCCPDDNYKFPNIITPSTIDGLNDTFTLPPDFLPISSELYIYNRWGKLVYKDMKPEFEWDGKVNGKTVKGVYYYNLTLNGYCIYHGAITVY